MTALMLISLLKEPIVKNYRDFNSNYLFLDYFFNFPRQSKPFCFELVKSFDVVISTLSSGINKKCINSEFITRMNKISLIIIY